MNATHLKEEFKKLLNTLNADFDQLEQLENTKSSDFEGFVTSLDTLYKKGIVFAYINSKQEISKTTEVEQDDKNTFVENPIQFSDLLKEEENETLEKNTTEQIQKLENDVIAAPEQIIEHIPVVVGFKEDEAIALNSIATETVTAPVVEAEVKKETISNLPDIKAGIGINDKFQFISNLFANNVDLYESAIKKLNADVSLINALATLEQMKKENNWSDENEAQQRFLEIVKRRFL